MNIVQFTRADADRVVGRPITDAEYKALCRTSEFLFADEFVEMVHTVIELEPVE